jgi:hypothetical protein
MGSPATRDEKMDRLAAGIMIAIAALVMSGGLVRDAQAQNAGGVRAVAAPIQSLPAAVPGPRSERVLSLVLTLEALRAAQALLDRPKV